MKYRIKHIERYEEQPVDKKEFVTKLAVVGAQAIASILLLAASSKYAPTWALLLRISSFLTAIPVVINTVSILTSLNKKVNRDTYYSETSIDMEYSNEEGKKRR